MVMKCPKCEKLLTYVTASSIDVRADSGREFIGAAYVCPFCFSVLSVELDPLLSRQAIVHALEQSLDKSRE